MSQDLTPHDDAGSAPAEPLASSPWLSVRARLAVLWVVLAVLLGVGVWFHWPFFVREHRRMEPWKGVLIWSSETVALLGFLWFGYTHLLRRRPFPHGPDPDVSWFDREHCIVLACFVLGLAIDGFVSWRAWRAEDDGLRRAEVVVGEIVDYDGEEETGYFVIHCCFHDLRGREYRTDFPLVRIGEPEAKRRLHARQFPIPIRIAYDPQWPDRNWLDECRHERGERLDELSMCNLLLQAFFLPYLLFSKGVWRTPEGIVPVYKLAPLLAVVFMLTLTVVMFTLMGRSFWPPA
jgi:hypothetical protein